MNTASPMTALKGVGDKTAALFHRVGVDTVGELLSYYPRTYDTYEKPVTFANLETDRVQAVTGFARRTPDSKKAGRLTVTTLTLEEFGMYLHLTWFNMPFLRTTILPGGTYIFGGRIQKKKGRLLMEQPEIYSPADYESLLLNKDRPVRVLDPKGNFEGTARGINEKGELLVERQDGRLEYVYAGEVSVRGVYGYV